MSRKEELFDILIKRYGIRDERELDEAIAAQGKVDISVFCMKTGNTERRELRGEHVKTARTAGA